MGDGGGGKGSGAWERTIGWSVGRGVGEEKKKEKGGGKKDCHVGPTCKKESRG
jgi:hypothetical protein